MMSAKGAKRSLRTISAHGKLEAIRRVHDGESKASVARDIGVPESTLRGWCKNESKISYLSRQSSPETDESLPEEAKRARAEEPVQPFNLSVKAAAASEALYTPVDYSRAEAECAPKTPQSLGVRTEAPRAAAQVSERERNRAELARLSVELGLNRPEMGLADLAANIGLLGRWNSALMQQAAPKKVPAAEAARAKPPKEQQSVEEYINGWLKAQEAVLTGHGRSAGVNLAASNGVATSASSTATAAVQNSWFWNWYKQLSYGQQTAVNVGEKPILYQQLTKDCSSSGDVENLAMAEKPHVSVVNNNNNNNVKSETRAKASVLDNLLLINNNNVASVEKRASEKDAAMSYGEAVEHGEKFLKWLETYSNPSVTAMQIMQFKALLNNVRNSVDRKNGDLQNKTKVKRK